MSCFGVNLSWCGFSLSPCVLEDLNGMYGLSYYRAPVDWQISYRPRPLRFCPVWSPFLSEQCWTFLKHNFETYSKLAMNTVSKERHAYNMFYVLPFTQMLEGSRLKISIHDFCRICKHKFKSVRRHDSACYKCHFCLLFFVLLLVILFMPSLTEFTMVLSAWNPSTTGNTWSLPSAISTSWS